MDEIDRFFKLFNRWSQGFELQHYANSDWTEDSVRVAHKGKTIFRFAMERSVDDEEALQRVYRLAYSSLHSWLFTKFKEMGFDTRRLEE